MVDMTDIDLWGRRLSCIHSHFWSLITGAVKKFCFQISILSFLSIIDPIFDIDDWQLYGRRCLTVPMFCHFCIHWLPQDVLVLYVPSISLLHIIDLMTYHWEHWNKNADLQSFKELLCATYLSTSPGSANIRREYVMLDRMLGAFQWCQIVLRAILDCAICMVTHRKSYPLV